MELILKLYVSCVMLSIVNFVITFNPGCAVKYWVQLHVSQVYFELVSCVFFANSSLVNKR